MDDHDRSQQPLAAWYLPAALGSLLFMGLGCVMYLMQMLADPAGMELDQRAAIEAMPTWLTAAQAVAVWVGFAGAAMLVLRRKLAEPLLLVSLIAVLVWLAGLLVVAGVRESMSANDLLVSVIVTALTWAIFGFARRARQRGWLG